jgi:hypothetical protein
MGEQNIITETHIPAAGKASRQEKEESWNKESRAMNAKKKANVNSVFSFAFSSTISAYCTKENKHALTNCMTARRARSAYHLFRILARDATTQRGNQGLQLLHSLAFLASTSLMNAFHALRGSVWVIGFKENTYSGKLLLQLRNLLERVHFRRRA